MFKNDTSMDHTDITMHVVVVVNIILFFMLDLLKVVTHVSWFHLESIVDTLLADLASPSVPDYNPRSSKSGLTALSGVPRWTPEKL